MPRKTKASAEEKAQIVEAYLRGEMGLKSAAAKLSVVISTMELWIVGTSIAKALMEHAAETIRAIQVLMIFFMCVVSSVS